MISVIQHISSRCGGGKSRRSSEYLCKKLLDAYPTHQRVVFASFSKDLNQQNYETFKAQLAKSNHSASSQIGCEKIDDRDYKGRVTKAVSELLESDFRGVIFTTHAVLDYITPELLSGVALICDEIPQSLVKTLLVKHDEKSSGDVWEAAIKIEPSWHPNFRQVHLKTGADQGAIKRLIRDIRGENDNMRSPPLAHLLNCLLDGNERVYVTTRKEEGGNYNYYQTVMWLRLKLIAEQVSSWTVLSAQLKESLFGFAVQYCLRLPIQPEEFDPSNPLEKKHKNRAMIVPFLKKGKWSKTLKMKSAKSGICFDDLKELPEEDSVVEYSQRFSDTATFPHKYLIGLNDKDRHLGLLKYERPKVISISVQGMNGLVEYDHAAYLGATVPKVVELNHLKIFAEDHGAKPEEIERTIMVERCYERAYQFLARTSIRNSVADPEKEHILIVPDMPHAQYLSDWFEDGYAHIVDNLSLIKRPSEKEIKAQSTKAKTIQVLRAYQQGQGSYQDLTRTHGINMSTFKECRKKNRSEFEKMGLPVPKLKKAKPI